MKRLRRAAAAAILLLAWSVSFAPGPARADFLSLGALIQFKAHKDNPSQVPIGTPVALVFLGAALLFLPTILSLTGNTIFDGADVAAPLGDALSCPTFEGAGTVLGESGCVWAKVTGQSIRQFDATTNSGGLTLGGQVELAPSWFLSGTLGAASLGMRDDSVFATGSGQAFSGSVALKHTAGPWYFAGALAAASRTMHLSRDGGQAFSDVTVLGAGLRLRGAYDFAFADWYLRPRLDLDLIHTAMPGFQETGPSPATLAVSGVSRTGLALTPAVEVGGRRDLDDGSILRPYLALGFTLQPDRGTTVEARFTNGALASAGSFQATTRGPGVVGNVEAGLQWYRVKGLALRAEYRLSGGDAFLSQTASLRGAYRF